MIQSNSIILQLFVAGEPMRWYNSVALWNVDTLFVWVVAAVDALGVCYCTCPRYNKWHYDLKHVSTAYVCKITY